MYCKQPDRHIPELECGYPMPCPWHTVIIANGHVILPEQVPNTDTLSKVFEIADVFKEGK